MTRQPNRRCATSAGAPKRVVAVAWHHYDDYWRVRPPTPRALLTPPDLAVEMLAPLRAGADGVLLWGHVDPNSTSSEGAAALQSYSSGTLANVTARVCTEFVCCAAREPGCLGLSLL